MAIPADNHVFINFTFERFGHVVPKPPQLLTFVVYLLYLVVVA